MNLFLTIKEMEMKMLLSNQTNKSTSCVEAPHVFRGFDEMMVTFYIIAITISTLGNFLLIFVIAHNPSMRTFTNCMICNCASSDLLKTLIPGILNVVDTLSKHTQDWMF